MENYYFYADTLIFNANIYTVDLPISEIQSGKTDFSVISKGFIAIKDGKIIGVGAGDGASYCSEKTERIDVNGATVIPGMIDSHIHALFAGIGLSAVQLSKCTSLEDMLETIKKRVENEPAGTWIKGISWNELSWKTSVLPDAKTLDRITGDHPFAAQRICGHVHVVNSKVLEMAGITKDTPDPEGGKIGRYEDGSPNGILCENAAFSLYEKIMPQPTEETYIKAIEDIGKYMNSVGITGVIDCNLPCEHTRSYLQALKKNRLTYRANLTFFLDRAEGDGEYHLKQLDKMMCVTDFGNDMLKFNGVKILLDGVPAMGTAYMRKSYKLMPETRGFTTYTQEELNKICEKAAELHWQMAIHAIGDAAMDCALESYKKASEKTDISENRNYLIHAVFPHDDQLPIFKDINVPVTIQPAIYGLMGEETCLREDEANNNQPAGWFFKNGIICGGGSDCPVVDCKPFIGMEKAINRIALDGKVHGPENRISPAQALLMWTMNSAYIAHCEDKLGSIEVGKLADLVVIDRPILEKSAEEIGKTKVLLTILNGKKVYQV